MKIIDTFILTWFQVKQRVKLEGVELQQFVENEREKVRQQKLSRKSLDSESRYLIAIFILSNISDFILVM